MKKVILFLDYANINRSSSDQNFNLDYGHLKYYMGGDRHLVDAFVYVPIDPRNEHKLDGDIEELQRAGYCVVSKVGRQTGDTYKCDFDVEITLDAMRIAANAKPDIIVLASGDKDFVPLVLELRRMGIRVECAAFETSISKDIILNCSGFINLNTYYEEYLAEIDNPEMQVATAAQQEQQLESALEAFPISDEEIDDAVKKLEDGNLDSYQFENFPNYLLIRDGTSEAEGIRERLQVYFEFENEGKNYLVFENIFVEKNNGENIIETID